MTDETLPAPNYLTGNRRQLGVQSTEGMGAPPQPYISIEAQKFTLYDASGAAFDPGNYGPIFTHLNPQTNQQEATQGSPQGVYLDAVLCDVNEKMSKVYYANAYSPGQATFTPPDCWSDNGIAPSVGARSPQNDNCATCEWNKWASKINARGNKVKACDDVKKLAWLVPMLNSDMVFLLRLKGSSHRAWGTYVEKVMKHQLGNRPMDPTDMITRIYFEPEHIGLLQFHAIGLIDQRVAALQDRIWQARSTDNLVGRNDRPRVATDQPSISQRAAVTSNGGAPAVTFAPPPAPAPRPANVAPFAQNITPAPAPVQAQEPPRRKRGRPPLIENSAGATGQSQPPSGPAVPTSQGSSAGPPSPPASFGIQQPGTPPSDFEDAIANAIKPLT